MKSLLRNPIIIILGLLYIFSIVLFFSPSLQAPFRKFLSPPDREVLSVASGVLSANLPESKVIKIRTPKGISIEVYGSEEDGTPKMIGKADLEDIYDAYTQFQGRATNLALKDIDGLPGFEIIAPSFSRSLVPKLHIFRYNDSIKNLETYSE